ncbi:hypothetical protein L7F22_017071 [Adiantum nelumboides]|nr:hypothetical protein [Adiantum nelumboides]
MAQQEKDDKPKKKKQKKQQQKEVEQAQEKGQDEEEEMETKQDEVLDDEGVTDLEYMYKRMRRRIADDDEDKVQEKRFEQSGSEAGSNAGDDGNAGEDDEEEGEEEEDEKTKRARERERAALEEKARKDEAAVDSIMTTGRLFVRNLPFSAKEEELEAYFSRYGDVSQTHITLDKATKQSKGIAFVTFSEPSHALAAFRASDGSTFQGRLLHVLPAVDARPRPEDDSKKTLKQKKQEQVKAGAQRDFNWSTLFMSADAVASSVADRLGIDKSDIVNPDEANSSSSVSPAVRLALAETRVIQETREYLEEQGIDVTSFSANEKAKRSDTTILVKNMPFGTSVEQLQGLFEPHGSVSRVVMPPAGTMAIVEMDVPNEARVAFRALAYKRMGNSLLYLEKAPVGLVKDRPEQSHATEEQEKDGIAAPPPKASGASSLLASSSSKGQGGAGAGEEEEAAATLFIKNLSFSTTDTRLASMFSHLDGFAFARIQTKQAASNGARISMGYGFVGFRTQEQAKVAQKSTNGKTLDGHQLAVAFARRGHDADDRRPGQATAPGAGNSNSSSSSGGGTKLIIKNLPFETSKKDLRALFAPHGTLKSVRVPRKAAAAGGGVGGARGFGFVEFGTRREAKDAMEALRYTHLLGRRLVVGWDDEAAGGVEVLREKARREQGGSGSARAAKTKLRLGAEDIKEAAKRERKAREDAEDDDVDDDQ